MFYRKSDKGFLNPIKGVQLKTLTFGESMSLTEFILSKGHDLPDHEHPHEQIGYLVSGSIELNIGGDAFQVAPGDSWCVPGGVRHGARVFEDSVAIEVFSPVRKDYIQTPGRYLPTGMIKINHH